MWIGAPGASRKLENLTRHYRIPHDDAHRALSDVRATLKLLSLSGADDRSVLAEMLQTRKHSGRRGATAK